MGPPKANKKKNKNIDVRQCTTPVFNYVRSLTAALSADQKEVLDNKIKNTKQELKAWIDTLPLEEVKKFNKHTQLEVLSDKLVAEIPDIPRDLFRRQLHYVLNGIQSQAESRKAMMMMKMRAITGRLLMPLLANRHQQMQQPKRRH